MIIKCPECGKEVSDKAAACPNCGCPISQTVVAAHNENVVDNQNQNNSVKSPPRAEEEKFFCPHCLSSMVQFDKKGFGVGKAVAGVLLTGGIGALAGTIGMNKIQGRCAHCNRSFTAAEAVQSTQFKVNEVKDYVVQNYGKLYDSEIRAFVASNLKNVDSYDAVFNIKIDNNISTPKKQTESEEAAGTIAIFILIISAIILIAIVVFS